MIIINRGYGLREWIKIYRWIVSILGYSYLEDFISTLILSMLILWKWVYISKVRSMIYGRIALVFGASPSLRRDIENLVSLGLLRWRKHLVIISADTAASELYLHGIYPDIIVTDLDGDIKYIILSHKIKKSTIVLHAHGDNIPNIIYYLKYFNKVFGTTQSIPTLNVYNLFGFTDGDRAIYLAYKLGARKIYLFGMEFKAEIGRYKKLRECQII